ncbi:MAG: TolC family protein [Cyanobacteriota bacterium]|nr:TolC family protein [Cyanobacteriota bacterium]
MATLRDLMAAGAIVAIILNSWEAQASEKTPPDVALPSLESQDDVLVGTESSKLAPKPSSASSQLALEETPVLSEEETLPALESGESIASAMPLEVEPPNSISAQLEESVADSPIDATEEVEAIESLEVTPVEAEEVEIEESAIDETEATESTELTTPEAEVEENTLDSALDATEEVEAIESESLEVTPVEAEEVEIEENAIEETEATESTELTIPETEESTLDSPIDATEEVEAIESFEVTPVETEEVEIEENAIEETEATEETELTTPEAETEENATDSSTETTEEAAASETTEPAVPNEIEESAADSPSDAVDEAAEVAPPPSSPEALVEAQQSGLTPLTEEAQAVPIPQEVATPSFLDPSPNPLIFPTRPSEVEILVTEPISLEQALQLAFQNNLELQRTLLELERSHANLREAQADWYPDIDLQVGLTRTDSASAELSIERSIEAQPLRDPEEIRDLSPTVSTNLTGQIGISYNIFTSGQRRAQIAVAEQQIRSDELEVERISEEIRLDVATDYYDLQEADGNVRINEAAVANAQQSLEDAEALERAGVGTQFDVLRAEVNLANAQQDLTGSLSDQRVAQRQLTQRLNLNGQVNLTAADEVEIAGLWDLSLEQTIVAAIKNRAELEQQLVQREISEQQRRVALSQIGPQVTLSANYNVLDDLEEDTGLADGSSIQATASWRLFDGGAARAAARQQEINAEIAENQFAEQRNQVRFDVERFYSDLEANLESIQTAEIALRQANEALELARLRFQAGVGTQTEVIDSETDLTRAEDNLLDAIINYNRSLVGLQRTVSNFPLSDYVLE